MSDTDFNPSKYAVEVDNLDKNFGSFKAVDNVSFKIEKKKIYGFLGPNGAGKSTTIRMLCGLLKPDAGRGHVAGFDVNTQSEIIKEHIGYMSQKFSLYEDLTVEENIDFYSGIYRVPREKKEKRKEWVIEMAGLTQHRHSRTSSLSGGWKQRLALGCAVLHKPPILFLDEPTSGVDPINRRRFWNLIYDLSDEGITIFVTTHYMDEAEYVDDIAFIFQGRLVASGPPEQMKNDYMKDSVLELFCKHPQGAMLAVRSLPTVKEVALFGRGLHIVTKEAVNTREKIYNILNNDHFGLESLEIIPPGMEDVFVSLMESQEREIDKEGV
ncbi:MAG: ABC transporter ATP-binding protein [Chlamydiota bacterium]|nr:ABC transporter ATP-binding protein [Chlamydiota bacterium]